MVLFVAYWCLRIPLPSLNQKVDCFPSLDKKRLFPFFFLIGSSCFSSSRIWRGFLCQPMLSLLHFWSKWSVILEPSFSISLTQDNIFRTWVLSKGDLLLVDVLVLFFLPPIPAAPGSPRLPATVFPSFSRRSRRRWRHNLLSLA